MENWKITIEPATDGWRVHFTATTPESLEAASVLARSIDKHLRECYATAKAT